MPVQVSNNAATTLSAAISASDTLLLVADGSAFPEPAALEYFYATLISTAGTLEIVKVTGRTGNQLTVERGAEGTTANGFAAGSRLELRFTAQTLLDAVSGGSVVPELFAETVNTTNLEVTSLRAKDGTVAGSIADASGVVTLNSVVLLAADINSGTVDGAVIGAATPSSITGTSVTANTSLTITGYTVTSILDEDNMASNSATALATQQSIKAYVDSQIGGQDLDIISDSGNFNVDLDAQTLTVAGGTGIATSGAGTTLTIAVDSTVATLTATQTLTNKTLTAPTISGGTVDGAAIGGTTPAAGAFTTLEATSLDSTPIGGSTPAAGTFTSLAATGDAVIDGTGVAKEGIPFIIESNTSRTLALTDTGNYIRCTSSSATTITIPPNSSVSFPTGAEIILFQAGSGQVTISPGGGVTLNSKNGNLKISAQYAAATCKKVATDTWDVIGDLSA